GPPPAFWSFMEHASLDNMPPPLQDAFLAVHPDPEALRRMHDRDAQRMRNFRDVPDEQIRAVQVPVLVLAGDRDVASPEHAAWLAWRSRVGAAGQRAGVGCAAAGPAIPGRARRAAMTAAIGPQPRGNGQPAASLA